MATQIFKTVSLVLQDDDETEVTVKPLPIARLRRFMDAWAALETIKPDSGDDGFDTFINCSGIALEHNFKGKFDALKASKNEMDEGEFLSSEYKTYLMDTLDVDTIYEILDVSAGIKLNDPKLQEAAMQAVANQQVGKTQTS